MQPRNPNKQLQPEIRTLPNVEAGQFAWRALRKYHNVEMTEGAMDLFDYYFAVPDRLTRIETFLGTGGRWP